MKISYNCSKTSYGGGIAENYSGLNGIFNITTGGSKTHSTNFKCELGIQKQGISTKEHFSVFEKQLFIFTMFW